MPILYGTCVIDLENVTLQRRLPLDRLPLPLLAPTTASSSGPDTSCPLLHTSCPLLLLHTSYPLPYSSTPPAPYSSSTPPAPNSSSSLIREFSCAFGISVLGESVRGLKLLVYEALSCWHMRP